MNLINLLRRFPHFLLIFLLILAVGLPTSCSSSADSGDDETESSESEDSEDSEDSDDEDDSENAESDESGETESKEKESDETDHDKKDKDESRDKEDPDEKGHKKDTDTDGKSGKKHEKKESRADANVTKIWENLMKGNRRFVAGKHTTGSLINSRKSLVKGQKPDVIVISCSDSRVPPELVFDKNLGELFVIRTAGNIADPIALGSIEYAAEHLHSKMLVVLGHETCGAVGATLSGDKMPTNNLNAIVKTIRRSFKGADECKTGGKGGNTCVKLNVTNSAREMVAKSPILKHMVGDGSLHIVKAIYEMESGKVVRF